MPIYEYRAQDPAQACELCRDSFEQLQSISEKPLKACPQCGAPVRRIISPPAVGASQSGLDDRAKNAGFSKFRKLSKGEYEKEY